ncbi:MAG: hypothetical protein II532_01180 [Bacteroidales bacterium]|nr:hypothetical protein [Bacteroidales bacterium]
MPVEEVVALLGEPTQVESLDNAADETTTVLHYEDDGLSLFFEGDNPTLQCIDLSNTDATLFGAEIFDMTEAEIVQLMISHNYVEQDIENEDWGERRITFNEGNIDFYLDQNDLLSIIWGI